jgi:peptidoglycan/xylan/chitin deacetylase (PgdA/CDA1 family)
VYGKLSPLLLLWYYRVKPVVPWKVRIALRRWMAKRIRAECAEHWPILEAAGKRPGNFPDWPEGKRFAFVLTHDVESQIGWHRCPQLAEVDAAHGFKASFNLVPEGNYHPSLELREWLKGKGFEVGVHDLRHDGKLYDSRIVFRRDAARINKYLSDWGATGFRSAFMHSNLAWLQELQINYDMSTFDTDPFEPFPEGVQTIFPFWYGAKNGQVGYVELPYTLPQDSTMFLVLEEGSIDIWRRKLDWIAQRGGMALLNTHPDYVCFDGLPRRNEYPVQWYREFLEYVRSTYAGQYWHALPHEVANYVKPAIAASDVPV